MKYFAIMGFSHSYCKNKVGVTFSVLTLLAMLVSGTATAAIKEVQLKSGERLLGEVLAASNEETLHLRSKLLGDLKLPRSSIASLKDLSPPKPAPKPNAVVAVQSKPAPKLAPKPASKPASKPVAVAAKPVLTEEVPKQQILQRLFEPIKEFKTPSSWSGNLRIGMNLSTGDKLWNETYARGQLSIKPKGSKNFYRFGGSYSYRKNEYSNGTSRVTSDKFDASALYRRSFSKGWFLQDALGYRVDNIKGIDHEIKNTLGAGYKFKLFKDKLEINAGGGLGLEDFQAANTTDLRNGQKLIFNIFQELTWKFSKRTTISQKINYFKNLKNSAIYDYNISTALRTRLTDVFGLELSYRKDFDSEVGGKQKNDVQWRSAFVIYF